MHSLVQLSTNILLVCDHGSSHHIGSTGARLKVDFECKNHSEYIAKQTILQQYGGGFRRAPRNGFQEELAAPRVWSHLCHVNQLKGTNRPIKGDRRRQPRRPSSFLVRSTDCDMIATSCGHLGAPRPIDFLPVTILDKEMYLRVVCGIFLNFMRRSHLSEHDA